MIAPRVQDDRGSSRPTHVARFIDSAEVALGADLAYLAQGHYLHGNHALQVGQEVARVLGGWRQWK